MRKQNGNPHVEQKNNSILRRNTGYLVLLEKHRIGEKAIRKYDTPKTPYQRVLESDMVPVETKDSIRIAYRELNPVELKCKINECQSRLIRMAGLFGHQVRL